MNKFLSCIFFSLLLCVVHASEKGFSTCFTNNVSNTSNIFNEPNTPSYNEVFLNTLQNLRYANPTLTKPSFIITPKQTIHIQSAVICAVQNGLKVRVRSRGHDYEGLSYISHYKTPFVLIDLAYFFNSNNDTVDIDLEEGTAWVNAGTTVGHLYYKISNASDSLAFPAGTCPTTGIGGHFAGGGIGLLMRKYGVAADNVVDALIVDAYGNVLDRKGMGEKYFWAIRGGGGSSFGIIIKYKIKLVQVPKKVTCFVVIRTLEQNATEIVEKWQYVAPKMEDELIIRVIASGDHQAGTVNFRFQILFLGSKTDLLSILNEKLPELGVVAKDCKEISWVQSVLEFADYDVSAKTSILNLRGPGHTSFKGKSDFVKEPISSKGWTDIWRFLIADGKGEPVIMIMDPWGGMLDRIEEDAIAFPHRKGNLFNIQYFMSWPETDEVASKKHLDWMRKFYEFMTPYVSKNPRAAYINYKDLDLGYNVHEKESFDQAMVWGEKYFLNNYLKLVMVKSSYDCNNVFADELTVPPRYLHAYGISNGLCPLILRDVILSSKADKNDQQTQLAVLHMRAGYVDTDGDLSDDDDGSGGDLAVDLK